MAHSTSPKSKLGSIDWAVVATELDKQGWALLPSLLSSQECKSIANLYEAERTFRNRVIMARHGYGSGEYRYFTYPLPSLIKSLRTQFYPWLAEIANRWYQSLGLEVSFPNRHQEFIKRCHGAGQLRPTPLLLKYGPGDFNCLHQDLYGEHLFPMQVAILLSSPESDFKGGEFVLTEQRPRRQSRATVIPLQRGDGVVFAVNDRPVAGTRGFYRAKLRHGVSTILSGQRYTLGIIFHDAL